MALIAAVALVAGVSVMIARRSGPTTKSAAPSAGPEVCAIDPGDGEAAIVAALRTCPDGTVETPTVVRFPSGRRYLQANRIEVRDRSNLVIDGNGSTFTITTDGSATKSINGNWVLLRGSNITLKNMTAVGSFNLGGPRSLTAESADPGYTEAMMNFGIYGTDQAWLVDVKGFNAWGDAVTLGPAHYVDPTQVGTNSYARNVHVIRMEARKTSRHCWSPTSGEGVWIEDSSCSDAWYAALDAETDNQDQPLRNHHYLRNTFDGFNLGGLLIPVPGEIGRVGDIEIQGNRFLTPPDVQCNPTLLVGGYPDPKTVGKVEFTNVTAAENEFATYARAVTYDHVNGGAIRNNKVRQLVPPNGATTLQHCGEDRQIIVTSSSGVAVEGNG